MNTTLKKYTFSVITVMAVLQLFIWTPTILKVFAYDRNNLALTTTGVNNDHGGFYQNGPYTTSYVGVGQSDGVTITTAMCNNDVEDSTGTEVRINIPREEFAAGQRYLTYVTGSAPSVLNVVPAFYDQNGNPLVENDPGVYSIAWFFPNETFTQGECATVQAQFIGNPAIPDGTDQDIQIRTRATNNQIWDPCEAANPTDTTTCWNYNTALRIRIITIPEFNIMQGEEDFYTGAASGTNQWIDPVTGLLVSNTLNHRLYVHNFTYDASAQNIRIDIDLPENIARSWTIPAQINASNAISDRDNDQDTLSASLAPSQTISRMNFVTDSVLLYGTPFDGSPVYTAFQVPQCTSNASVPCYSFDPVNGMLQIYLPEQFGCSPYIQQVIFATTFTPQQISQVSIDKTVVDEQSPYDIGDTIDFQVEINNTGNASQARVRFEDRYNSADLEFNNDAMISMVNAAGVQTTPVPLAFESSSITGDLITMVHSNLALVAGNLPVGGRYVITMSFTALRPSTQACNEAQAELPDLNPVVDNACTVIVGVSDVLISKTAVDDSVEINDSTSFIIRIRNNGNVPITTLQFDDTFDTTYLRYVSATGSRRVVTQNGDGQPIDGTIELNATANNGTIQIQDLTTQLGDLGMNEYYYIQLNFVAIDNTQQTCDIARATIPEGNVSAQDCVEITEPERLPNTSK